eukprot:GHVS01086195.1.p1 GENE.GHVS01086195.1~~GHVS01086195.1.p1  ORF type:complete len:589 (+),score=78.14 GHVS01086195.1:62-1828(+)
MPAVAESKITVVPTSPIDGQKPGTSGVRKKTKEFMKAPYLHNFTQAVFNALKELNMMAAGQETRALVVSGDGRFWTKDAIKIICEIAAANGVSKIWIGKDGLLSTPAASAIIRERGGGGHCMGGFLLTASHNPGGIDEDFGVKYNGNNGGPATETTTDAIYKHTQIIKEYRVCENLAGLDVSKLGKTSLLDGALEIEVIDPVEDWLRLMGKTFDFGCIKNMFKRDDFSMLFDGMHGVAGPYAKQLFVDTLGANPEWLMNCVPKEDFGGGHPDPNLTYAHELVKALKVLQPAEATDATPAFGAAGDGDCDRNMILGRGFFVTPSDSVAVITAHAKEAIPYFEKHGIAGVSRSMPTSGALDRVAAKMGLKSFVVPTGWKFFGNLMDAGKLSICGEESFGTGSNHVREKDGLWAVLCWLSILAKFNKDSTKPLVGVRQIVEEFWKTYGRNYYSRYDYENVDTKAANQVMDYLLSLAPHVKDMQSHRPDIKHIMDKGFIFDRVEEFEYKDPVDHLVSKHQGIQVFFRDGSRVVYRLSGTGSHGATIRVYMEKFDDTQFLAEAKDVLKDTIAMGVQLAQLEKFTGRTAPTVIT